jgi:hypothetical protein
MQKHARCPSTSVHESCAAVAVSLAPGTPQRFGLARARKTNHAQQLRYPWLQELRNAGTHTVQWCAVAPEASQHPWRQEHLRCQRPTASACTQVRGPARFRASARPSGALTTVPHITAAQAAGTGCSFGRCQGSCDTCCTIGPPKSSPAAHHAAWVCTKPRARVGRHTRGPTYPDIDIGASQTDSALMRGAAAGEGPARPRRCRCPRVKRVRLSTLGCHMQKFQDPRVA